MPETPDIPEELPLDDVGPVPAEATSPLSHGGTPERPETAHDPETAKEHQTMLEVHPAHHAASSWKEFFIHIATIVLGLLIAVGLEQAVEYFHHRREIAEVRKELRGEREANKDSFKSETTYWRWETAELENNLMVLAYLQKHAGTHDENCPAASSGSMLPVVTARPSGMRPRTVASPALCAVKR